jgi:hypothetical protein
MIKLFSAKWSFCLWNLSPKTLNVILSRVQDVARETVLANEFQPLSSFRHSLRGKKVSRQFATAANYQRLLAVEKYVILQLLKNKV